MIKFYNYGTSDHIAFFAMNDDPSIMDQLWKI